MGVPAYTTPTFMLTIADSRINLTRAYNVYVTFTCGAYEITKTGEDLTVEEHSIGVYLNQSDTSKFKPGYVEVQANWTSESGDREATEVENIYITKQLLRRVVV